MGFQITRIVYAGSDSGDPVSPDGVGAAAVGVQTHRRPTLATSIRAVRIVWFGSGPPWRSIERVEDVIHPSLFQVCQDRIQSLPIHGTERWIGLAFCPGRRALAHDLPLRPGIPATPLPIRNLQRITFHMVRVDSKICFRDLLSQSCLRKPCQDNKEELHQTQTPTKSAWQEPLSTSLPPT